MLLLLTLFLWAPVSGCCILPWCPVQCLFYIWTNKLIDWLIDWSEFRRCTVEMLASSATVHLVSQWPWPLTSDLESLFSNAHSHDEYVCPEFLWNSATKYYRDVARVMRKPFRDLAMTLTFDLWTWKPLQQCPLTRWIFVPSFIEIPPLSIGILRHAEYDSGRTDGRQTWKHKPLAAYFLAAEVKKAQWQAGIKVRRPTSSNTAS